MAAAYTMDDEFAALAELAKARRRVVQDMFSGTRLRFKQGEMEKTKTSLKKDGKSLYKDAKTLAGRGGGQATTTASSAGIGGGAQDFIGGSAGVDVKDLEAALGLQAKKELMAEITPVVGLLTSAGNLAKAIKAVKDDSQNLYRFNSYKSGFMTGDAQKAAEAVKSVIERDLAMHSVDLARESVATGAKIAGLFTVVGTGATAGIGLANTLAKLGLKLARLGMDIKQMNAGNARLKTPQTLDMTVFEDSPVLGCYLLTCADTSSVAQFFIADIGLPGWMERVEKLKREKMDPLLKIATKELVSSPLQLEGLSSNKGTFAEPGFFARKRQEAVRYIKKRF